jgi:hypothetical protein
MAYDPSVGPDRAEWLALDEGERMQLVAEYHRRWGEPAEHHEMHTILHAVVETQVAMGDATPAAATLRRLRREGLTRHEGIHAISCVLVSYLHAVQIGRERRPDWGTTAYYDDLKRLTRNRWYAEYVDRVEDE